MFPWEKQLLAISREDKDFLHCFGCGQDNDIGLKLDFCWDGEIARAEFTPGESHQGWNHYVHGGLLCTLLDEAMSYAAYFQGVKGVTSKIEVRFRYPAPIGEPLHIAGNITKRTRKLINTRATITLADDTAIAESTGLIYMLPRS